MVTSQSSAPTGLLLGSETPRLWTPPLRELTAETSRGFEAIEFAEEVLGLFLMPWQKWALIHALELNPDGTFRFRTLVILVARQNGKTTLMLVLALWRMYVDGAPLVIGTAQKLDVAEEAWELAVELAESNDELQAEIAHVDRTNGKKALRLTTGERYKVSAASRGGGRGLSGDEVFLDELREHKTWEAWAAVTKTTMARPNPQVVCLSNAGDSQSIVLAHLRQLALAAIAGSDDPDIVLDASLGLLEWSAPDDCDLDDAAGIAQANPALGHTITFEAIASARATDPEPIYRTEVLCQWVDQVVIPLIDPRSWDLIADPESQAVDPVVFGVDVSPDRRRSAIAVAGKRPDHLWHVEVVDNGDNTEWLLSRLLQLTSQWAASKVALDPATGAGSLIAPLTQAGVEVVTLTGREDAQACGAWHDAVMHQTMRHLGQEQLDQAVFGATTRRLGEAWAWTHRGSEDITPLVGGTVALWAAMDSADADYDIALSIY